jgi:hypothetical protein
MHSVHTPAHHPAREHNSRNESLSGSRAKLQRPQAERRSLMLSAVGLSASASSLPT